MIEWILQLEIQSPNVKEHWGKIHARNKKNRRLITYEWMMIDHKPIAPCTVQLQRLYNPSKKQKPYDVEENLRMAFKGIKDIIADILIPGMAPGQADEGHGIAWKYDQLTAMRSGVRIIIMTQEEIEEEKNG